MSDSEHPSGAIPDDVVTGFWLWVLALPLMVAAYVVASVTTKTEVPAWLVNATSAVFAVNIAAVVAALLFLLRNGYRWARTVLTGAGAASVVYSASTLLNYDGSPAPAVAMALTSIIGSVLIGGGGYLLHRKDAHGFFTR